MARFRFSLEALLRARRAEEQRHQRVVAEIQGELATLHDLLQRQQAQVDAGRAAMRDRLTGALDPHDLRLQAAATLQQMRTAQRLVPRLAALHQSRDAARAELIEASRRRRAIELLRERRFEAWKREQSRAETARLDELAIARAAQRGAKRA